MTVPGNEPIEPTEPTSEVDDSGGETTPEAAPTWGGPSEQEWKTIVAANQYLVQRMQELEYEPEVEEEPDYENMDMASLLQTYVDNRLGEMSPYVQQAAQQAGEKRLNEIFDAAEKDERIGKFDRDLAGQLADAMWKPGMDPVQTVYAAAQRASQFSKREREAGLEEYKASLKKNPFDDLPVGGGGNKRLPTPKSYDEVVSRWSGEEEV